MGVRGWLSSILGQGGDDSRSRRGKSGGELHNVLFDVTVSKQLERGKGVEVGCEVGMLPTGRPLLYIHLKVALHTKTNPS
jgi:hypothetical protein